MGGFGSHQHNIGDVIWYDGMGSSETVIISEIKKQEIKIFIGERERERVCERKRERKRQKERKITTKETKYKTNISNHSYNNIIIICIYVYIS